MPMIIKRIEKLEKAAPNKNARPVLNGLGDFYEWEATPEGQAELDKLYDENRDTINPNEAKQ